MTTKLLVYLSWPDDHQMKTVVWRLLHDLVQLKLLDYQLISLVEIRPRYELVLFQTMKLQYAAQGLRNTNNKTQKHQNGESQSKWHMFSIHSMKNLKQGHLIYLWNKFRPPDFIGTYWQDLRSIFWPCKLEHFSL